MFRFLNQYRFRLALSLAMSLAAFELYAEPLQSPRQVLENYSDIAFATYSDALTTAESLQASINALVQEPTADNLANARQAWLDARVPYGQTEGFRFGNPVVDEWEIQVNTWPLDEGLIDYVTGARYEAEQGNEASQANIIGSQSVLAFGEDISTRKINADLLKSFNELGGSEANVATGYHAIEFLLWGRDLNAKPTDSGQRPATDYNAREGHCTNGRTIIANSKTCERRGEYLTAAAGLLVGDLREMTQQWAKDKSNNYRQQLLALPSEEGLKRMLRGVGALAGAELSNERMRVALLARSQEDEHSCFSDNTHVDIVENAQSIRNIYLGSYRRIDGTTVKGASLSKLVEQSKPEIDRRMREELDVTTQVVNAINEAAQQGEHFDQQILDDNPEGNRRIQAAISVLEGQTDTLLKVAAVLSIQNLNTSID